MLPAVFCMIIIIMIFIRHLCSLFQYLSVLFQFQLNSLFLFLFLYTCTSQLWWDSFDFLVLVSCEQFLIFCMAWSDTACVFFCYLYICLFPAFDCFDGIKHSFASMQLNAFHGKLSTTVNSIHFPLHPSCLLFLPVALSIIGFRCQLYCENLANCIC